MDMIIGDIMMIRKWLIKIFSRLLKPVVLNILNEEWNKLSQ